MPEERIRATLEAGLAESGLPGIAVAAVTPEGREVNLALGRRASDAAAPMTPDTLFWIASMTKAITSAVALQLAAEGRVDLDEPVGRWLPQLAEAKVLEGFDEKGAARLRPAKAPVTLRNLLMHSSGLGYDFASPDLARWIAETGANMLGPAAPSLPLIFDPGQDWAYGLGIDYAGKLIEILTGRDLGQAFQERIFGPLGMTETTFALTPAHRERLAAMHARLPDGGVTPTPFGLPDPPYFQMGGGGLYSTARDYLRFLRGVMGEGTPLLPPEFMGLFTTSQMTEPRPGALVSAAPHLANDYDAFPGRPTGWSLGFLVNLEQGPGGRSAGSLAWAGLSNCYYWVDRERGSAGVFLAQLLPFADPGVLKLFERFERAVYDA